MFNKYDENSNIIGSSNIQIDETYIEEELTEQEIQEQIISQKTAEIRQKFQDLIFAKYSLTTQLNMSHSANDILAKALIEKRDLTESEKLILSEYERAKLWIDEQRQLCADEISLIA